MTSLRSLALASFAALAACTASGLDQGSQDGSGDAKWLSLPQAQEPGFRGALGIRNYWTSGAGLTERQYYNNYTQAVPTTAEFTSAMVEYTGQGGKTIHDGVYAGEKSIATEPGASIDDAQVKTTIQRSSSLLSRTASPSSPRTRCGKRPPTPTSASPPRWARRSAGTIRPTARTETSAPATPTLALHGYRVQTTWSNAEGKCVARRSIG